MPSPGRIGPIWRLAWLARLAGEALALYLRLVAATSRVSGQVTDAQVVLAFWHEFNLAAIVVCLRRRGHLLHASFSTRGFRGLVITALLERLGLRVYSLPDPANRAEARDFSLRLARLADEGYTLVVTPDGPFGPYHVAKPGALIVARASSLPIVAWGVRARPSLRLRRRWDRHLVPLPFSRLHVVANERLLVPPRQRLAAHVPALQKELDSVTARADA
jgi:lysophospholipid acyltransferase (LPLAT)-like uncharacterized protein